MLVIIQFRIILASHLHSKHLKIKIYIIIILSVILYGREIWSLTLKKGDRFGVFENRVMRRL
jgi:hypothetical protein